MAWFFKNKKNSQMMMDTELSAQDILVGTMRKQNIANQIQSVTYIMIISMLFGFAFYVKHEITLIKHSSQVSIAREADILSALNNLQSQLSTLEVDHQQMNEFKADLEQVQHDMVTQQSLTALAKNADLEKISNQLDQLKQALNIKRTNISRSKQNLIRRSPLTQTVLPFKVESLDNMAGQPFASVIYHQQFLPVRLNDSLAGWKAIKIDISSGVVVWENAEHQQFTVTAFRRLYA